MVRLAGKPKKKVEPKSIRKTSVETRYFIFQITDEGRVIAPTERGYDCCCDHRIFDYSGYDSEASAMKAIEEHLENEDERDNRIWPEKTFYDNGKTSERSVEYFVIPRITVRSWWEKV